MKKVAVDFKKIVRENKLIQEKAEKNIQSKFLKNKNTFFSNFEQHPITKEINNGPNADNLSNTLNGIGNLFSFIGFYRNSNPIKDLKSILEKNFSIRKRKIKENIQYIITHPTLDKIKTETPMPWEGGRSWVVGIERGISGFSDYMYKKFREGRSGEGLQNNKKVRGSSYRPTRYITNLINNFVKDMKS